MKAIEVTDDMKYHARCLLREVERQGGDFLQATWIARFSDADGDGKLSLRVSEPGGDWAYWKGE